METKLRFNKSELLKLANMFHAASQDVTRKFISGVYVVGDDTNTATVYATTGHLLVRRKIEF